ncbi:uncharacterized protein J7T54_008181 [Emericellopsis cladophorae]|uniref:Uncharacterized protein n=1 Tax=Emericellopsis cladophorae TaxID=2686198 RepID=A0A9Q0BGJ2_9HYPO|nr:uncharacterized protein J7T54_008181 [Emericellopsis cladophorae]KAI6785087.1 hypothetical protein J7T54_008181 [Emericellopsis cladophorae]
MSADTDEHEGAICHIEHYANIYDFASRWGVLNYTKETPVDQLENRFMGKLFINPRAGHQFNQHYLDSIFPLDPTLRFTRDPEDGDFMEMDAMPDSRGDRAGMDHREPWDKSKGSYTKKMRDVSRLWQYRNGRRLVD